MQTHDVNKYRIYVFFEMNFSHSPIDYAADNLISFFFRTKIFELRI